VVCACNPSTVKWKQDDVNAHANWAT
jgi:hypothetical protein